MAFRSRSTGSRHRIIKFESGHLQRKNFPEGVLFMCRHSALRGKTGKYGKFFRNLPKSMKNFIILEKGLHLEQGTDIIATLNLLNLQNK